MVKDFLGEDSEEYQWIKKYQSSWTLSRNETKAEKSEELTKAFRFIDGCEIAIEQKGFYKKPKENFTKDWNSKEIIGILLTFTLAVVGLGYWGGTLASNNKIEKLKDQVATYQGQKEELNKQILILQDSLGN